MQQIHEIIISHITSVKYGRMMVGNENCTVLHMLAAFIMMLKGTVNSFFLTDASHDSILAVYPELYQI